MKTQTVKTPHDLKTAVAVYHPRDHKVTVKGVAGASTTIRVLLNPNVSEGMSDDQIYNNYAQIPALDKKEVQNAGHFFIELDTGDTYPPYGVVIATSANEVSWPEVKGQHGDEVLYSPSASHTLGSGTVTVTGQAGANDTVRALLNPTLPGGMGDDQIFDNYATIPALDKKEKQNAGQFTIILNAGMVGPPYTVVVVTNAGDSARPPVIVIGGSG
jgi:hypothetical protein